MATKQIHFYLTLDDLNLILPKIENEVSIKYIQTGLEDDIRIYDPVFTLQDIQFRNKVQDYKINNLSYLVSRKENDVKIREIPQRKGGIKYAVDQLVNPGTIIFRPSRIFPENIMIAGNLGTVHGDSDALNLLKTFTKFIKGNSKKIGVFYVGKKAEELLQSGWRFTSNIDSPAAYDLKIS